MLGFISFRPINALPSPLAGEGQGERGQSEINIPS